MNPGASPYASNRPQKATGRDHIALEMHTTLLLARKPEGVQGRSQLLVGLRGVGKSTLLRMFGDDAQELGMVHEHVELSEDDVLRARLQRAFAMTLMQAAARRGRVVSADQVHAELAAGDLTDLFDRAGRLAHADDSSIFLTVDHLHLASPAEFGSLMAAAYAAKGRHLPVRLAGAALGSLPHPTRTTREMIRALFSVQTLGPLARAEADQALAQPAEGQGVRWEPEALDLAWEATDGYPLFVQQVGSACWAVADGPTTISAADVRRALPISTARLDDAFFAPTVRRLPEGELRYLGALLELGPGPVRSSDVARRLGRTQQQLAPVREALRRRALCHAPAWGDIECTVPHLDRYLRRAGTHETG